MLLGPQVCSVLFFVFCFCNLLKEANGGDNGLALKVLLFSEIMKNAYFFKRRKMICFM